MLDDWQHLLSSIKKNNIKTAIRMLIFWEHKTWNILYVFQTAELTKSKSVLIAMATNFAIF